jgi:hypothetical protein
MANSDCIKSLYSSHFLVLYYLSNIKISCLSADRVINITQEFISFNVIHILVLLNILLSPTNKSYDNNFSSFLGYVFYHLTH